MKCEEKVMQMQNGPEDKRKVKGEKTKEKIISSALDIIMSEGRAGLTARNLALAVGISKASLFHHFDSMDEILMAVVEQMFVLFYYRPMSKGGKNSFELVSSLGHEVFKEADQVRKMYRGLFTFMETAVTDPVLSRRLREMIKAYVATMGKELQKHSDNRLTEKESEGIALAMTMLLDAAGLYLLLLDDQEQLENTWHIFSRMVSQFVEKSLNPEGGENE